jgi:hypothetical protein
MVFDKRLLPAAGDDSVPGGLYVNRRHGIAFRVPEGWEFVDLAEVARTREGMRLNYEEFDPEAWAESLRELSVHEAFTVVRDLRNAHHVADATSPDVEWLAAGVGVYYEGSWNFGEANDDEPSALAAYVEDDLETFAASLRDYRVLQAPRPISVSGRAAMEHVAQYSYMHRDLPRPATLRERVIYVYRRPALYTVRMFDFPEVDPPVCYDFDAFVTTLRVL